jgi:hypothetical protein
MIDYFKQIKFFADPLLKYLKSLNLVLPVNHTPKMYKNLQRKYKQLVYYYYESWFKNANEINRNKLKNILLNSGCALEFVTDKFVLWIEYDEFSKPKKNKPYPIEFNVFLLEK